MKQGTGWFPIPWIWLAEPTRLELATSDVTGRRSNRLNYGSALDHRWWAEQGSNLRPPACKADALPAELSAREERLSHGPDFVSTNPVACSGRLI